MMRIFDTPGALAEALADDVAAALAARLQTGPAVLAVSGGQTPVRFFAALAQRKLDWARVTVTLVDDRWVPESSPRSNAALVRAHLLQGEAAAARFLPLVNGAATPEAGREAIEAELLGLPLPLTVAVLGMGLDGHTASFFPGSDGLVAALAAGNGHLLTPLRAAAAGEPRITLTLPVLLQAAHVALHIEGAAKREVLDAAQRGGSRIDMPVRAILARLPAPEIFWSP
jgi:6-phosphogluconolactonase